MFIFRDFKQGHSVFSLPDIQLFRVTRMSWEVVVVKEGRCKVDERRLDHEAKKGRDKRFPQFPIGKFL